MSDVQDHYGKILAHLRSPGMCFELPPWPGDLTEEEQVAFMSLPDLDAGIGIIAVDMDFARRAIALGSTKAALE